MIAAIIFALAIVALLQFFVSYCRSLVVAYSHVALSDDARECAALPVGPVRGEEFGRLLGLVRRSKVPGDDSAELGVAHVYYLFISMLHSLCPSNGQAQLVLAQERNSCAHMVAVALDRRLVVSGGSL
jgi:hypothetical protein